MIRTFITRLLAVMALAFVLAVPATASAAYDIHTGVDCGAGAESTFCKTTSTSDPVTGSDGVLHNVTRIISAVAGAAAVIIIVLGGFRYITSNGEAEEVSKAKKTIIFAAIGLLVVALGQAIINIVISKA